MINGQVSNALSWHRPDDDNGWLLMGQPAPIPATVVWWRHPASPGRGPGVHRVGWVDVTGRPNGRLDIPSPHLWLDPRTIGTALHAHLVPHPYAEQPTILAAGLTDLNLLSTEARLIVDGHTVTDTDLSSVYGLDVVAVVSARHLGAGPRALVAVEETLHPAVRTAAIAAAGHAVADFATATVNELTSTGWSRRDEGRWQLHLHQH